MSQVATLVGKEVRTLFTSPIAYAVIAVFVVLSGYTFTVSLIVAKQATLVHIFFQSAVQLILLVPLTYKPPTQADSAPPLPPWVENTMMRMIGSDFLFWAAIHGLIVLKLAGEWGTQAPPQFRAVAVCCPAIDLATSADALHEPSNRIYETYFLWQLRRRLMQKARLFPDHFDTTRLRGIRSLREFDDKVTAYYCGFTGVDDYYDRASAAHVVERIAVPTLVLHAANDPFVHITAGTRRKISSNKNITFVETADGGHCAFVGDPVRSGADRGDGRYDDGYWAEHEIVNFLRSF